MIGGAMTSLDAIVLGAGGVGSATLYHLARRGLQVLGIEQFSRAHDQGSSHGHTRIIRKAYFEHPDYVPLLQRAYELWHKLEHESGQRLYEPVGLVEIGPPEGVVIPGILASARQHDLKIEMVDRATFGDRFPGLVLPEDCVSVFEADAGYLLVEDCVRVHLEQAEMAGATLLTDTAVTAWRAERDEVVVQTPNDVYRAKSLIIAAGAWARELMQRLNISLEVVRKHLHWFNNTTQLYRQDGGFPVFFYERPGGFYYGFPQVDARGVKLAQHQGGTPVVDLSRIDRTIEPDELRDVRQFVSDHMPGLSLETSDHTVCLYTRSRDEHFVIDRHPEHENVFFAAGLSGHGFKFTSVLGQILADYICDGQTRLPAEFLKCSRW
jgi:sarcosine oxidase